MGWLDNLFGRGRGEPVIIVSGLPRSGTSMAMKMLDAAGIPAFQDGIRVADEDNPRGYYEHERVKDLDKRGADRSWVREARGKALKVISFLLPYLPGENDYRIVFMSRTMEEVLASQAKMLERRNEDSETEDRRMTELYEDHLQKVKNVISVRDNMQMLEIHYSDVVTNSRREADRIAEFLKLPPGTAERMAAQVDSQLYRNRA
ncbi:MAG: sulfotransferase domain-containing protein [Gemmatimonadetes bacterium]|nr:sulfotransferase domain-containing protein [Gemmatimonadota bacterium]